MPDTVLCRVSNGFFNQVISVNTLYSLKNPTATLVEFFRVLKDKGRLVLVNPKEGYENGLVLREHCRSKKTKEYWSDFHASFARETALIEEAVTNIQTREQMIAIALHNRSIKGHLGFHFLNKKELVSLVTVCRFVVLKTDFVYARQGILVVAEKRGI